MAKYVFVNYEQKLSTGEYFEGHTVIRLGENDENLLEVLDEIKTGITKDDKLSSVVFRNIQILDELKGA